MESTTFISSVLKIAGADTISKVRSQDRVKYYNVVFTFPEISIETLDKLENLWPYNTVFLKNDGTVVVEFMVRPEETKDFSDAITGANIDVKQSYDPTVILRFPEAVPEKVKVKLKKSIRNNDRIIWGEDRAVIVLNNCKNPEIVERRLREILQDGLDAVDFAISIC